MSKTVEKKRILWIDVAKFLGIFMIYLGHFGEPIGHARVFVALFHVPLFFFLSGCMSTLDNEPNYFKFAWKKCKQLLIPYACFNVISIAFYALKYNCDTHQLRPVVIMALKGDIRNQCVPFTLWFFTGLFVMELIFKLLKYLKYRVLICMVCLGGFILIEGFMTPPTGYVPHWWFNVDSVLYFIVYYALGYALFPYIKKLFEVDTKKKKILFWILGLLATAYAAYAFEGRDGLMPLMRLSETFYFFSPVVRVMILIWFILFVSKLIEKIPLFCKLGRETLYLCGNEYLVKELVPLIFAIWQIDITFPSPVSAYVYNAFVMLLTFYVVIPFEKKVVASVKAYAKDA